MRIAITGATGFLGRYVVARLTAAGHACRCWYRPSSDRADIAADAALLEWLPGQLGDWEACEQLVSGCDAVVHAALDRPGHGFRGAEGDVAEFAQRNVIGTLQLIEAARAAGVARFVFISTCAVHEKILDDRPLDESHPLWATSHYGAHKAAIEKFVHSYGLGAGYPICALRPTGIYGLAHPATASKWFDLVAQVARGETVECRRGGKEVHVDDVARAVEILLSADGIAGEAYSCYDRYVSEHEVATIAKRLSGSDAEILGEATSPKHQIETAKIRALGMEFGGVERLEATIAELLAACD
ncbi:MAG: NAD(P)-dependent oxidoreductase [Planctomycetota bacterium]|nr:MAG: NAD(P)-dependent oxidoreductase [Planctomycetota bacterium]REJ95140.1 MAG: NAD(P)-dependent oxidoreductase [Planctomycetota bacterium]